MLSSKKTIDSISEGRQALFVFLKRDLESFDVDGWFSPLHWTRYSTVTGQASFVQFLHDKEDLSSPP